MKVTEGQEQPLPLIAVLADGVPQCYDEATLDSSLATFHVGKRYSRRIKHFSGYNISTGFAAQ